MIDAKVKAFQLLLLHGYFEVAIFEVKNKQKN